MSGSIYVSIRGLRSDTTYDVSVRNAATGRVMCSDTIYGSPSNTEVYFPCHALEEGLHYVTCQARSGAVQEVAVYPGGTAHLYMP